MFRRSIRHSRVGADWETAVESGYLGIISVQHFVLTT
jgi:hypothetical protein